MSPICWLSLMSWMNQLEVGEYEFEIIIIIIKICRRKCCCWPNDRRGNCCEGMMNEDLEWTNHF